MMFLLVVTIIYLWAFGVFLTVGLISDRKDRNPKDWKIELVIVLTWPVSVAALVLLTGYLKLRGKDD